LGLRTEWEQLKGGRGHKPGGGGGGGWGVKLVEVQLVKGGSQKFPRSHITDKNVKAKREKFANAITGLRTRQGKNTGQKKKKPKIGLGKAKMCHAH